uniref:Uncharacterized protein n=1 Tax=Acrobeloides nanus TaxID=290746 RepID=A0A914CGS3_9BILA
MVQFISQEMIPNEHITFAADPYNASRTEDAIIAYTWDHFLNDPSQPNWLLRFPMVKASIRALDTITDFVNTNLPHLNCHLDSYIVAGASKRGWTTWLVGAVDPVRVKAIVPIVLDAINFVPVMHHAYRSYGGWSFALEEYMDNLKQPITSRFDDPNMILLQQFIDPYYYRDRLTMPKLVVNAVMDEFQQPDDTHYWWKDMPEPKHFLIAPNAEHTQATGVLMIVPSIAAFGVANFLNKPVPTFTWDLDVDNGKIVATVENDESIHEVNVWWAYSCGVNSWDNNRTRRDFRIVHMDNPCYCGNNVSNYCANVAALWDRRSLQPTIVDGKRTYAVSYEDFDPPSTNPQRWLAFMIDFKFDNPYGLGLFGDVKDEINKIIQNKIGKNPNVYFGGLPEDLGGYFDFTSEVIIPNEDVIFTADPFNKSRTEDAAIAFTWDHFLNDPSQPNWLIRFPMVKGSIRALDTITDFVNTNLPHLGCQLDYYIVAGASKRGWTTWLVGAVDPVRVKAIVPIVLDAINFVPVMHHAYRSYGGWSFALIDYVENLDKPITSRFDDPNMILLQQYVDPYYYRDRLTMPKMVVNAVLDEFQQPDDTHYWWKDMPEPKHFLIAPNAEHTQATGMLMIVPSIAAFALATFLNKPVPTFTWDLDVENGKIVATVENNESIHEVNVWWAYSCGVNSWDNNRTRRDFRIAHKDNPCYCGIGADNYCANLASLWDRRSLQPTIVDGKRTYTVSYEDFDPPSTNPQRWLAFMIDFKFDNPYGLFGDVKDGINKIIKNKIGKNPNVYFGGLPEDLGGYFEFTSEVMIWPNSFPYEDCFGAECGGRIL